MMEMSGLVQQMVKIWSEDTGTDVGVNRLRALSGGSINQAFCLETSLGSFFLKYNTANRFPGMFEAEARGLRLLNNAGVIRIPNVVYVGSTQSHVFLILEFLDRSPQQKDFWETFGRKLAALHRCSSDQFGLDHSNYIGSLTQSNTGHIHWHTFFIEERLEPQLRLASNAGLISDSLTASFKTLFSRMVDMFPVEQPSLLHGDLWSGNFLIGPQGEPCLIDPAVYFGHREMDLAMTRLFGGFEAKFYRAYQEVWPLQSGWQERMDLCNLYPLMVHVNLFGGGYLSQVKDILRRFV
ncbi:MAG: fructosamine kinase family protein [Flavobacteriales bacterium]|nr:fructosamine kinase family protein [Flavobacteriales bacterium]